jgi:replication factor C subunit 3/5
MLLIDKYEINNRNQISFHKELYSKILNISNEYDYILLEKEFIDNNKTYQLFAKNYKNYNKKCISDKFDKFKKLSNLLIHGHTGSGKKTLIKLLLKEIYGETINYTKKVVYTISGYGNSDIEIEIEQSNYHIVIEPRNSGFDKYVIQEIVKEYAQKNIMQVFDQKIPFKIILINNVDELSYYAQTSLRCTMERYHETCKFILCGYQISKIIEPLRSRCLNIRIPRPSDFELFKYLINISIKEKIKISLSSIKYIINKSDCNVKNALWYTDYYKNNVNNFDTSWKIYLKIITEFIYSCYLQKKKITLNIFLEIRNILNNILITNITGTELMIELLNQIITMYEYFSHDLFTQIISTFSDFEIRMSKGKRYIIHLEALIMKICYICYIAKK